jgi:hypothetical protein
MSVLRFIPVGVGLVVLSLLARPLLLGFLDGPLSEWPAGIQGILFRLGLVLVGAVSIRVYSSLIRGTERSVLASLPVDPAQVSRFQLRVVLVETISWIGVVGIILGPIALRGYWGLWLLCVCSLGGMWFMSVMVSGAVHLWVAGVADSPSWGNILDLIRGANPRAQAAFIYAPGVILMLLGFFAAGVSYGVPMLWSGKLLGIPWLVLPFLAGILALWRIPGPARRNWYQASAVIADIDARYGALQDQEEVLRVYMDWAVRFLPPSSQRWALKDLRHGWRARRGWISATWLIGLAGLVSGWTASGEGAERVLTVIGLGIAAVGFVAVVLARDEPAYLERWLGNGGGVASLSRMFVIVMWLQVAIWPGVFAVCIRSGLTDGIQVVVLGEILTVFYALTGVGCARAKGWGMVAYFSSSMLTLGLFSALYLGG